VGEKMSNTLRYYPDIDRTKSLIVTAFVAGDYGAGIQLTIQQGDYICLSENQIKDLIFVLKKRLSRTKGFSATDISDEKTINPEPKKEAMK
jgi:hypothetical protein